MTDHNTQTGIGSIDFLLTEFPGFPVDSLPDIPDSLPMIPAHWHNDACPSWIISGDVSENYASLFIDFPEDHPGREMAGSRYIIATADCETIAHSDDWAEILDAVRVYQNRHGAPTDRSA